MHTYVLYYVLEEERAVPSNAIVSFPYTVPPVVPALFRPSRRISFVLRLSACILFTNLGRQTELSTEIFCTPSFSSTNSVNTLAFASFRFAEPMNKTLFFSFSHTRAHSLFYFCTNRAVHLAYIIMQYRCACIIYLIINMEIELSTSPSSLPLKRLFLNVYFVFFSFNLPGLFHDDILPVFRVPVYLH